MNKVLKKNALFVFVIYPVLNLIVLYICVTQDLLTKGFLYCVGPTSLLWGGVAMTSGLIIIFFLLKKVRLHFCVDDLNSKCLRVVLGIVICFCITLLCTIFELCVGLIECYFWGHQCWNYETSFLNYRGIICLRMSSMFLSQFQYFTFFYIKFF